MIPAAILVLTGIGLVVWMQWSFRNARADLEREIALVRQSGEPLSGLELEAAITRATEPMTLPKKLLQSLSTRKNFSCPSFPWWVSVQNLRLRGRNGPNYPRWRPLDEQAYAFEQLELLRSQPCGFRGICLRRSGDILSLRKAASRLALIKASRTRRIT